MNKIMFAIALLVVSAGGLEAQTTYNSTKPFVCDAASRYPVQDYYEFQCRGIALAPADNPGTTVGSFYLFGLNSENKPVEVYVPGLTYQPSNFDSYVTKVDSFTKMSLW